mmetsp:Transcript_13093/g.38501  ORF Transcript_13093/g.38501 Transcript_13093/m.38501 type:complete len:248 (+) Transcript_13093:1688-2431(+)
MILVVHRRHVEHEHLHIHQRGALLDVRHILELVPFCVRVGGDDPHPQIQLVSEVRRGRVRRCPLPLFAEVALFAGGAHRDEPIGPLPFAPYREQSRPQEVGGSLIGRKRALLPYVDVVLDEGRDGVVEILAAGESVVVEGEVVLLEELDRVGTAEVGTAVVIEAADEGEDANDGDDEKQGAVRIDDHESRPDGGSLVEPLIILGHGRLLVYPRLGGRLVRGVVVVLILLLPLLLILPVRWMLSLVRQ